MQISLNRLPTVFFALFALALVAVIAVSLIAQQKADQNNVVIFVTDGLRPSAVNAQDTPTLYEIRQQGGNFVNSHSLFPTFTTANASVIATGHYLGDTGDFSNTINVGFSTKSANNSLVPFLENNAVLGEVNKKFGNNYLNEESLSEAARKAGFSTAAVLPPGFLAIDIAHDLKLSLVDPDKNNVAVVPTKGEFSKNSLLKKDAKKVEVIVAGNGGSDLIYLPKSANNKAIAKKIVDILLKEDYVSGLFVNDALGSIPGTLPLSSIGLRGAARTPTPSIVVNFTSFDTGCGKPSACGA